MDEPPKKRMKMDAGDDEGDLTAHVSDLLTEEKWIPDNMKEIERAFTDGCVKSPLTPSAMCVLCRLRRPESRFACS